MREMEGKGKNERTNYMHHHPLPSSSSSYVHIHKFVRVCFTLAARVVFTLNMRSSLAACAVYYNTTRARPTRCVHIIHTLIFVCYLFSGKRQHGSGAGAGGGGKSDFFVFYFPSLPFPPPLYAHTRCDRPPETNIIYEYSL